MQYAPLIGRILFAAVFIMFGLGHLGDAQTMADNVVPAWVPMPVIIVYLTGIWIAAAGIMTLVGFKAKMAGLMLAAFLIPTALLVWGSGFAAGDQVATGMFMKDMGLAGAALLLAHFGAGPFSMDAKNS